MLANYINTAFPSNESLKFYNTLFIIWDGVQIMAKTTEIYDDILSLVNKLICSIPKGLYSTLLMKILLNT